MVCHRRRLYSHNRPQVGGYTNANTDTHSHTYIHTYANSHCHANTQKLADKLCAIDGVERAFSAPVFHEVALTLPQDADTVLARLPGIMEASGAAHRIELYPGTVHGFAFPQRPAYNKPAAERHWQRLFALFDRRLRSR